MTSDTSKTPGGRPDDMPEGFIAPLNTDILAHWDKLDSRLYNLRHELTPDGKPLSIPLDATPTNPKDLPGTENS
ncbi:hypothetical protein ACFXDE_21265 [Kitasatospora sp. NPDC059408]|uniref:hypothetical protein n=1 Tax=Kitasatospora sp. NPDC059408 TaxID=3346823 RepID=UPI0036CDD33E